MSSELFPRFTTPDLEKKLTEDYDISILAFVRNPVDMRESGYQQSIRMLAIGEKWRLRAPQDYYWHSEYLFLKNYQKIFGIDSVKAVPYDFFTSGNMLLEQFLQWLSIKDSERIADLDCNYRQNERLGFDYLLFLLHSLWLPLQMNIRLKLYNSLMHMSKQVPQQENYLLIPLDSHMSYLQEKREELEALGKEFLNTDNWYEHCTDILHHRKEPPYRNLPQERQKDIFNELPATVQDAISVAGKIGDIPSDTLLPPIPTDRDSYAFLTRWFKALQQVY